jgi:HSP20 family protein
MLMRTDPFRDLDRLTQQVFGSGTPLGTWSRPNPMPMEAYRAGDTYVVSFDLPGVAPEAIELDIERNVLTVKAERRPAAEVGAETQVSERTHGVYSRQMFLGDTLDTDHIEACYEAGVLTLRIPVAAKAKPRQIAITAGASANKKQINV